MKPNRRGGGTRFAASSPEEFKFSVALLRAIERLRDELNEMEKAHRKWVELRDHAQDAYELVLGLQRVRQCRRFRSSS